MLDYPEEVAKVLNVLCATDFDPILKHYEPTYNAGLSVSNECISFLQSFVDDKKEEALKIKSLL